MHKSNPVVQSTISLSTMRTWQSGILQSSVHRSIKKLSDHYLKQFGLTTMHWFIIGAILDAGNVGIRITDLAEKIGTTTGYLVNTINNLELRGMIDRTSHDSDNRTKVLTIPQKFQIECIKIEEGLRELFREELYKKITRDELNTYLTVMQKLSQV